MFPQGIMSPLVRLNLKLGISKPLRELPVSSNQSWHCIIGPFLPRQVLKPPIQPLIGKTSHSLFQRPHSSGQNLSRIHDERAFQPSVSAAPTSTSLWKVTTHPIIITWRWIGRIDGKRIRNQRVSQHHPSLTLLPHPR